MSMVERVAEAIFLKEGRTKDVAWKDADKFLALFPVGQKVSDYYRGIARAAIEAMRRPSDAMVEALEDAPEMMATHEGDIETGPVPIDRTRLAWGIMIDAALSERGGVSSARAFGARWSRR